MSEHRRRDDARGMMIGGLITLGIGLLFLLRNMGMIPGLDVVWPVFPIIVGAALIVGAIVKTRRSPQP